jgi:UrcA family protein
MSTSARTRIIHVALIIAALSPLLWGGTALAGPASKVIQYGDLDLSTDAGVHSLYQRIKAAASKVCLRETSAHHGVDERARYFACYKYAVANAVQQLGQARLAALHREQSGLAAN